MSLSQSQVIQPSASPSTLSHIHTAGETCPTCDQSIPHDRFDEIKERIENRQAAREAQITARLLEEFECQKAEAIEKTRREAIAATAAQVASARQEERQKAEASANEKLTEADRLNKEAHAAMQARIEEAQTAKATAEQINTALQEQLVQTHRENEATIQKVKQDAESNAVVIRKEAQKQAEATVEDKITTLERTRQESESAFQTRLKEFEDANVSAQRTNAELLARVDQMRSDSEAVIAKVKQDAETRVITARQEISISVEAAMYEKITDAEQCKAEAEAKAIAAEQRMSMLQQTFEVNTQERVNEVRTAMETAMSQAVNAAKAVAYEEKLKLSEKMTELQRTIDKKTAEEIGEGAEINLLEALKSDFPCDRFEHVGKGNAGADIIHTVMHNSVECGKIIYDSKDHNQWRYDFTTKLASDKIAANADIAILSVRKFPEGARQLHVHDGIIIANPARVLVIVQVVRDHIVKSHSLRLSNEAKVLKSAELYSFITSAQFLDLLARIDTHTQELLDMQVKEQKVHQKIWKDQAILFRSIQKTGADLSNRIDIILGTAGNVKEIANEE